MLTVEALKPLLLHSDGYVRDTVVRCLRDAWARDAELVPTILAACRRFGFAANDTALHAWDRFPLDSPVFEDVVAARAALGPGTLGQCAGDLLVKAPVELLRDGGDRLRREGLLSPQQAKTMSHRIEAAGLSAAELWDALVAFARRAENAREPWKLDWTYVDGLVEALGRHDFPGAEAVCERLADPDVENSFLELVLVDLAGACKMRKAVPELVRRLGADDDWMPQRVRDALVRIGDVDAVRLIREDYPSGGFGFRMMAAEVLEGLRLPESEDAGIALLEGEPDLTIRTMLCHALCRLFSPRGVELARKQVADGYDRMMVDLEDEILVAADVLGLTIPESDDWRRQRENDELRRERRRNEMARLMGARTVKDSAASLLFNPKEEDDALAPVTSGGKVGRNEPCSCGSGKKYKRCCGGA
ncbi:MAG: hypothetical protein BroJett003_01830 [Planctomycetota bacterium]|nr:MAG: hypothetical protein BroJett003_01830 [Planctomycetota bacterium]